MSKIDKSPKCGKLPTGAIINQNKYYNLKYFLINILDCTDTSNLMLSIIITNILANYSKSLNYSLNQSSKVLMNSTIVLTTKVPIRLLIYRYLLWNYDFNNGFEFQVILRNKVLYVNLYFGETTCRETFSFLASNFYRYITIPPIKVEAVL